MIMFVHVVTHDKFTFCLSVCGTISSNLVFHIIHIHVSPPVSTYSLVIYMMYHSVFPENLFYLVYL